MTLETKSNAPSDFLTSLNKPLILYSIPAHIVGHSCHRIMSSKFNPKICHTINKSKLSRVIHLY